MAPQNQHPSSFTLLTQETSLKQGLNNLVIPHQNVYKTISLLERVSCVILLSLSLRRD